METQIVNYVDSAGGFKVGDKLGSLTIKAIWHNEHKHIMFDMLCDCGGSRTTRKSILDKSKSLNCGDRRTHSKNIESKKYNRWSMIGPIEYKGDKQVVMCRCDCGVEKVVSFSNIKYGLSKSCGCLSRETTGNRSRRHGASSTLEYARWVTNVKLDMDKYLNNNGEARNKSGILVHPEWGLSFDAFLESVGKCSPGCNNLIRIDTSLGYIPGNVKWGNKGQIKPTNCRYIEIDGIKDSISGWSRRFGVNRTTIVMRLEAGWEERDAVGMPSKAENSPVPQAAI